MGITYNDTKYVYLCNKESFKSLSLEDNVYFTLRDIFMNANNADDAIECNNFNNKLTNNICFEERTDTFTYTDVLQDKLFIEGLIRWLNACKPKRDFFFTDSTDEGNDSEYITLDTWMESFNDLKHNLLPKRLDELKK